MGLVPAGRVGGPLVGVLGPVLVVLGGVVDVVVVVPREVEVRALEVVRVRVRRQLGDRQLVPVLAARVAGLVLPARRDDETVAQVGGLAPVGGLAVAERPAVRDVGLRAVPRDDAAGGVYVRRSL